MGVEEAKEGVDSGGEEGGLEESLTGLLSTTSSVSPSSYEEEYVTSSASSTSSFTEASSSRKSFSLCEVDLGSEGGVGEQRRVCVCVWRFCLKALGFLTQVTGLNATELRIKRNTKVTKIFLMSKKRSKRVGETVKLFQSLQVISHLLRNPKKGCCCLGFHLNDIIRYIQQRFDCIAAALNPNFVYGKKRCVQVIFFGDRLRNNCRSSLSFSSQSNPSSPRRPQSVQTEAQLYHNHDS